jgi:6-pyruvoyl-tetrahydropterin synthase
MRIEIARPYPFHARHQPGVDHAHVLWISIAGEVGDDGMVLEFGAMDKIVLPIVGLVKGRDMESLHERCSTWEASRVSRFPTVENLLVWFARRLELLASARPGGQIVVTRLVLEEDGAARAVWERAA